MSTCRTLDEIVLDLELSRFGHDDGPIADLLAERSGGSEQSEREVKNGPHSTSS
jgi:hypothetical protein